MADRGRGQTRRGAVRRRHCRDPERGGGGYCKTHCRKISRSHADSIFRRAQASVERRLVTLHLWSAMSTTSSLSAVPAPIGQNQMPPAQNANADGNKSMSTILRELC